MLARRMIFVIITPLLLASCDWASTDLSGPSTNQDPSKLDTANQNPIISPKLDNTRVGLVRNWAVVRYNDYEEHVDGAKIEVCYESDNKCVDYISNSKDRYLIDDLRWGDSLRVLITPFNGGGEGPQDTISQYDGSTSFKVMDNLPKQVLGLRHYGEAWTIASMMPHTISSKKHPVDPLLPTNFDSLLSSSSEEYSDGTRGVDAIFNDHTIRFLIEYDKSNEDAQCVSIENANDRIERIAPPIGRLPIYMLEQIKTIYFTNHWKRSGRSTVDAWTSSIRPGFIGVSCMAYWEYYHMEQKESELEETLLHEVGHLLPMPEYWLANSDDFYRSRDIGEPHWFVSHYAIEGTHVEPSAETLSAWFIAHCARQVVAGDGSIIGGWNWGFHQALLESFPNRMAYFDDLFSGKDMSPYTCVR